MSDADRSWLDRLADIIPGYGGYRDCESRRRDDAQTREYLAKRLADCRARLDRTMAQAAEQGNIDLPHQLSRLANRLELAENRLRSAVAGYASWFDERQVDAARLQQVLEHDRNLVSLVDRLDQEIATLLSEKNQDLLPQIEEMVQLLHDRIDRRSELLAG